MTEDGRVQRHQIMSPARPCPIVVMGVSGSGKSTLGAQLAASFGCTFLEGDAFHTDENVTKMRSGRPLDDADRWPWLDRLGAATGAAARADGLAIAACSALKRAYRQRLADAAGSRMLFVLLDADPADLARRLSQRPGHYMPASLLDSQLATLERPRADESALVLDSRLPADQLIQAVRQWANDMPRVKSDPLKPGVIPDLIRNPVFRDTAFLALGPEALKRS